jgi:hypothetical protein
MCETWHSYPFRNAAIDKNYCIIENFGTRTAIKGRLKNGYIIGYRKELIDQVVIIDQTHEFCTIQILYDRKFLFITFAYISPSSTVDIKEIIGLHNPLVNQHIIVGDLNCRIGQFQCMSSLSGKALARQSKDSIKNKRGRELINHLTDSNYYVANGSCISDAQGAFTFCSNQGQSVIDIGIVSQNLMNKLDFQVMNFEQSTHFPILLSLTGRCSNNCQTNVIKIVWDPSKCSQFNERLYTSQRFLISDISLYSNHIKEAAELCDLVRVRTLITQYTMLPKWFDSKCLAMKKETRRRLRQFRKARTDTDIDSTRIHYLQMQRTYKSFTQAKRTTFMNSLNTQLCQTRNAKEFYSALSHYRPKFVNANLDDKVPVEEFRSYYANLFSSQDKSTHIFKNEVHCELLDRDFSFNELNYATSLLSHGKAPGSDGIVNEVWKNLSTENRLGLLDCINDVWRKETLPAIWSEVIVVPIYKKGSHSDPQNFRPISLVNTCLKLITSLMTIRLDKWCSDNKVISEYQAAYKKGTGCDDHVFTLSSAIQWHLKNNKNSLYALFIDFSKAFDSINYTKLWERLESIGLSTKFINIIKCMYANARGKVRTSTGESSSFPLEKGVLQGETLSPRLFTIVMDELVSVLHNSNIPSLKIASKDIHLLLYADDIVVLASNVFDLQDKIDLINTFFVKNDLKINLEKTKLVIFRDGRRKKRRPNVYWNDSLIEIVDHYTYLGVTFYANCSFKQTCINFINKAKCAESQLHKLVFKSKMKTLNSRISLFNSLVRSILMDCSAIWGVHFVDKLESFQCNFLRRIFGLPRKTPNWYLRLESACDRIELSYVKNLLNFWKRIMSKPTDSLVRVCYDALESKVDCPSMKWNWVRDVRELLAKWDCEKTITKLINQEELCYRIADIHVSLGRLKSTMNEQDIIRMNVSSSMPFFKSIKTHLQVVSFLNLPISWDNTKILVQLRANMSEISSVKLRVLEHFYNINVSPDCPCCQISSEENLFHFVFICPRYNIIRIKYLSSYCIPLNELEYLHLLKDPAQNLITDLCNYVKHALRLRNILLEQN